jgi:hypothetical protein
VANGTVLVGQSASLQVLTGNPNPTNGPPTPPGSLAANGLQTLALTLGPPLLSYTNVLHPGVNFIANQLDHGSNTFAELFPNAGGVRNGDMIEKYICSGYTVYVFDSSSPSGFSDSDGNPIAGGTLVPGEGAVYNNQQGAANTLIWRGRPHVPVLPAVLPCGVDHYNLLGRQTNDIGTYQNIIGAAPQQGAQELIWNGTAYNTYTFSNGAWTPGTPRDLLVGESALFLVPSPPSPPAITQQPASLTVTQGQTATFTVTASGTAPLSYTWHIQCQAGDPTYPECQCPICPASANITLTNVQPSQSGNYYVVITNAYGSVTSTVATLTVVPLVLSYDINIHTGLNLIANQLDHGSNRFDEIFTGIPDGLVVYKFDNSGSNWTTSFFSAASNSWSPSNTLKPGEGAFFQSPSNFTLTIRGNPHVPVLPVVIPNGATYLLSRQTNDFGSYANIVGGSPVDGATLYKWLGAAYKVFHSDSSSPTGWKDENGNPVSEPVVAIGEAAWISPLGNGVPAFPRPVITQQPSSLTVTQGQSAVFSVAASSASALAYQWIFCPPPNWNVASNIVGATSPTLTLTNVTYSQAGLYLVIVSNSSGSVTSSPALLTVHDTTPPVIHCPGNITRYVCGSAVKVYYKAWAQDDGGGTVTLSYDPPSGSYFTAGTMTIVNVTATDASGNVTGCSFTVTIIENSIWQTLPAGGDSDCFKSPTEPVTRSACLNSAYPGVTWRAFDDVSVNRFFGQSWLNLPNGLLNATLTTVLRPCLHHGGPHGGTTGQPENDSIELGLDVCSPVHWQWGRYIGSGNPSAGLLSTQWRTQSGCGVPFTFQLGALPPDTSLLSQMNSTHRFDMIIQDDTAVDYAWLRVRYCPPPHILGGLSASLDNAILAYGWNTWCLLPDPVVAPTNYTIHFGLGDALGVKAGLTTTALNAGTNGVITVQLSTVMPDTSSKFFGLSLIATNGTNGPILSVQPAASAFLGAQLNLRLHGVQVAQQVTGPGVLPESVHLAPAEVDSAAFSGGSKVMLHLAKEVQITGVFGSFTADEIQFSVAGEPDWLSGVCPRTLDITASNVAEVGVHGIALELDGQYETAGETGLAQVNGSKFVLSPLGADSDQPVVANLSTVPTSEFRALFGTPFGVLSSLASNASLSLITRGVAGGTERDLPALRFDNTGSNWSLSVSREGVPAAMARVQIWNSGTLLADLANPTNVLVTSLPTAHWPGVTWFVDDDVCHRFPYATATTVFVNGNAFEATELRVLTATYGQPVVALTGERIEAVKPDVLALYALAAGPENYELEAPDIGEDVTIRWKWLGGVLETATNIGGPWTPVPNGVGGEVTLPDDGAVSRFFRVRSE